MPRLKLKVALATLLAISCGGRYVHTTTDKSEGTGTEGSSGDATATATATATEGSTMGADSASTQGDGNESAPSDSDDGTSGNGCQSNDACSNTEVCLSGGCVDAYADVLYDISLDGFGLIGCESDPEEIGDAYYRFTASDQSDDSVLSQFNYCEWGWVDSLRVIAADGPPTMRFDFNRHYDDADLGSLCTQGSGAGCDLLITKERIHTGAFIHDFESPVPSWPGEATVYRARFRVEPVQP